MAASRPRRRASPLPSPLSQPAPFKYASRSVPESSSQSTAPSTHAVSKARRLPLILLGLTGAGISFYCVSLYMSFRNNASRSSELALTIPADNSARFNATAERYDSEVDYFEWLMGITRLRRQLVAKAQGHVLEVSVGTGRNGPYYPLDTGKIKSMTMVDKSTAMIQQARQKWTLSNVWFMNAGFRIQDAAEPVPGPRSINSEAFSEEPDGEGGFDTIVQTMGLCSTGAPDKLLQNLGNMLRHENPSARILLLEHGRSKYNWLNNILDQSAPAHAERHGCWWNKDIGEIVARSGLEVVEARRYHFGTTWWFELKPSAAFRQHAQKSSGDGKQGETDARQAHAEQLVQEARDRPGTWLKFLTWWK